MSDVKTIIDLIEAGDARVKAIAETQAANQKALQDVLESSNKTKAEKDEAVAKINAEFVSLRKELTEIEKKANRPKADGGRGEDTPEQAEYRKAFNSYLRTGEGDSHSLKQLGRKAMNSSSDPDGGYLVLPEMDMAIDRVVGTIGAMARLADTITIGTQKWEKMVKTSGMAMRRVANGATGGETTEPKYSKVEIEVFPAEVEPWVFNETLDDVRVNLESDLANEAAIGFAEGANAEFVVGTGVGGARGITAYTNVVNSSYAWGSVGYVRSGKSAAFMSVAPSDRVISLQHALKAQYRPGAVWLTNDSTLSVMRQMKDGSGSYYLWQPDPAAAFGGRFLGAPVEIDDNMPALGAGSYSLAYGNFKRAYKVVNRAGTTLIRDNITAKGQTKFNFRRRFGGGIVNYEAIKLMAFVTGAAGA
jgi:HK97 family phage major capsid protein